MWSQEAGPLSPWRFRQCPCHPDIQWPTVTQKIGSSFSPSTHGPTSEARTSGFGAHSPKEHCYLCAPVPSLGSVPPSDIGLQDTGTHLGDRRKQRMRRERHPPPSPTPPTPMQSGLGSSTASDVGQVAACLHLLTWTMGRIACCLPPSY